MTRIHTFLTHTAHVALLVFMFFGFAGFSQEKTADKISPSLKLSYKITDGVKVVKVEASRKEGKKYQPIENLIINLYYEEVKKYDPNTAMGWVENKVTDDNGMVEFTLSDKFMKLTSNTHVFKFIASIGSNPAYEDTQEEITLTEVVLKLSSKKDDSLTTVTAQLSKYQDSVLAPSPETEMKLFVKRAFGMLPFGEENLSSDENGEVSGTLPPDLPGNADKTITVVARYEDQENEGIIEVSQNIAWSIPPRENKLTKRTLWSSGSNAPYPLVIVTVSLIAIIWGVIIYLISFLFKIKKLRD